MATVKGNRIHDSILIALQENSNPESGIQQAMELLENLNKDLYQVTRRLQDRELDEHNAYSELEWLERIEKDCRWTWIDSGKKLASLKRGLDKLTFANNAYKDRSIKTEEKINLHNLYFQMHHGTNNMAQEKKLMKEINGRERKGDHIDSSLSTVEEINNRIRDLQWKSRRFYIYNKPNSLNQVDENQILEEIKELKWARDRAFANAPVKGKTWNSLPSKNAIKKEIKLMEMAFSDEDRKEHLHIRAQIDVIKQKISAAKRDINCLKRQQWDVNRKNGEAYNVILKLIKAQDQAM